MMPRLTTSLLRRARAVNPLLVPLLRTCRDLPSARNELRWIREHVDDVVEARHEAVHSKKHSKGSEQAMRQALTKKLCHDRGHGKPLQYVLGTEWFSDLEIACEPGVLIPRPETASMVMYLANVLSKHKATIHESLKHEYRSSQQIQVLDLCSGSGCMSLLLAHELLKSGVARAGVDTLGIDISPKAIRLARRNAGVLQKSFKWGDQTTFRFSRADVLAPIEQDAGDYDPYEDELDQCEREVYEEENSGSSSIHDTPDEDGKVTDDEMSSARFAPKNVSSSLDGPSKHVGLGRCERDIVIANPPYISPRSFKNGTTTRSVRSFEPTLALVPPPTSADISTRMLSDDKARQHCADTFYPPIIHHSTVVGAKVLLLEVGDLDQATRVARMACQTGYWSEVQIWKDGIDQGSTESTELDITLDYGWVDRVKVVGLDGVDTEARVVVCWGQWSEEWLGRRITGSPTVQE